REVEHHRRRAVRLHLHHRREAHAARVAVDHQPDRLLGDAQRLIGRIVDAQLHAEIARDRIALLGAMVLAVLADERDGHALARGARVLHRARLQVAAGRHRQRAQPRQPHERLLRTRSKYITGTRKSDSTVDDVRPPTTASASGWLASVPCSSPIAVGMRPITVASEVMTMGTKRERAASTIDSTGSAPSSSRRAASSTRRMPFDTAMPMTMRMPMSAVIEKPWPAASSAVTMPTSATGIVKSMMNGSRSERNCDAMIMNTTMTASASARPRPPKVVRM